MATAKKALGIDALTSIGAAGGWAEITGIVSMLGCAFALVALGGWHPGDPTPLDPGTGRVENWCGPVGALLADLMYGAVGWGAWAIAVPPVLVGLWLASRPIPTAVRMAGWLALYVDGLAALHLLLAPGDGVLPGGTVGWAAGAGLQAVFGPIGAWFGIGGTGIVLLTGLFRIDWGMVLRWLVDRLEVWVPKLGEVAKIGALRGGSAGVMLAGVMGALGWRAVRKAGVKVGDGLGGMHGAVRRMGESLVRDDDPFPALHAAAETGRAYLEEDAASIPVDPTVPRSAMVAEVQWDPTPLPDPRTKGVLDMFPDLERRPTRSDPHGILDLDDKTAESIPRATRASTKPAEPAREQHDEDEEDVDEEDVDEDDLDEDDDSDDADGDEDEADDASDAPPIADLRSGPSVGVAASAKAQDVVVHRSKFLNERILDDGGALGSSRTWELPPLSLMDEVPEQKAQYDDAQLRGLAELVEQKLLTFKIGGHVNAIRPGPVVTLLEFVPDPGVKVSKVAGLADDLAMALKAEKVRVVAPIPGRGAVGIEIPSPKRITIFLREVLGSDVFRKCNDMALPLAIGKDAEGRVVVADLGKMPHLLIGGTTGSGKSVGVNGMLMSLLFTRTPDEVRIVLIDPKKLEFEMYHDIPHLLHPVITDATQASAALAWACREMDARYEVLARWGVRNIDGFNKKVEQELRDWSIDKAKKYAPKGWTEADGSLVLPKKLPHIVIIIDELADLMMVAKGDVETSIARIAQKARACGMHLIVATQRPSVDVVTGLIKANLPTRLAYTLRSEIDSRTILDQVGAKQLLNLGDCLYLPPGAANLMRAHAAFVKDDEVLRLADFWRAQATPDYIGNVVGDPAGADGDAGPKDELYDQAVRICVQLGKASTSLVQRHLKIGYNRAANLVDQMEAAGVVGPADGARPREVLITAADL